MGERIGTEIAGYLIESLIARGGMGEVYLATQTFPERRVALKLLAPDLAADPAFRERFIRESNAAASTEHPNIVPIYGAGESDGELYLAMRFIDGTDLRTLIEREGALESNRATRICASVADALEAAHERGLVHRDVKPGNVLLDRGDRAYLADFGLIRRSRVDASLTRTGQFTGTLDYVAPEQIRGEVLDGRADVYSLGCVLYECLTGSPPFRRDADAAILYAHLNDPPPRPSTRRPEVAPGLDVVVEKAMAKRPDDRHASAGEMGEALRRAGGVVAAGMRPRRIRTVALVSIVAVVAAIVGALAIASQDDGGPGGEGTTSPTPSGPPLNTVFQVDPTTGEILATPLSIPRTFDLPQIAVGEGGVWIGSGGMVVHVDPDGNEIVDTTDHGRAPGGSLDVGFRTVWWGFGPRIIRIDPADDDLLRAVRMPSLPAGASADIQVAVGASAVWAISAGELVRIDPALGTIEARIGADATALVAGLGGVWLVDDLTGTVTRVDPETYEIGAPIPVPGNLDHVAIGAGSVWLLDSDAGFVTPLDPATGELGSPIRVGTRPIDLAVGLDAVWVVNQGDGTISRIDPLTGTVTDTLEIGGSPAAVAVDVEAGRLWVATGVLLR